MTHACFKVIPYSDILKMATKWIESMRSNALLSIAHTSCINCNHNEIDGKIINKNVLKIGWFSYSKQTKSELTDLQSGKERDYWSNAIFYILPVFGPNWNRISQSFSIRNVLNAESRASALRNGIPMYILNMFNWNWKLKRQYLTGWLFQQC